MDENNLLQISLSRLKEALKGTDRDKRTRLLYNVPVVKAATSEALKAKERARNPMTYAGLAENMAFGMGERGFDFAENTLNTLAGLGSKTTGIKTPRLELDKIKQKALNRDTQITEYDPFTSGAGGVAFDYALLQALASSLKSTDLVKPLQESLGKGAGKVIAKSRDATSPLRQALLKRSGEAVAEIGQSVPYTVASLITNVAEGRSGIKSLATDVVIDTLIGATFGGKVTKAANVTEKSAKNIKRNIKEAIEASDTARLEQALQVARDNGYVINEGVELQIKELLGQQGSIGGFSAKSLAGLEGVSKNLLDEAKKYKSAEEFRRALAAEGRTGSYYHITDNPNFKIKKGISPTEMISSGGVNVEKGLMITSNIDKTVNDAINMSGRNYVAKIDTSKLTPEEMRWVGRGFNEYFIPENVLDKISVKEVVPYSKALKEFNANEAALRNMTSEDLLNIWNKANTAEGVGKTNFDEYLKTGFKDAPDEVFERVTEDQVERAAIKGAEVEDPSLGGSKGFVQSIREFKNKLLAPIRNMPEDIQQAHRTWFAEGYAAGERGQKLFYKFADIPEGDAWKAVDDIEHGVITDNTKAFKKEFDEMFKEAKELDPNIRYWEGYITHIWEDSPEVMDKKIQDALGQGFKFSGGRDIPTYKEGIEIGLQPKYHHPSQIIAEYARRLEETKANVKYFKWLKDQDYIVSAKVGKPLGYEEITAKFFPKNRVKIGDEVITGNYYAPRPLAQLLNNRFGKAETAAESVVRAFKDVSGFTQDVTLSGGVKTLNFWTLGNMQKEAMAGFGDIITGHPIRGFRRVSSPLKAFFTGFSEEASKNFRKANVDAIEELSEQGVKIHMVGDFQDAFPKGKLSLKEKGQKAWRSMYTEPTFQRFLPMLEVEFYKDMKMDLIRKGLDDEVAKKIAAEQTKNFYGIVDSGILGREPVVDDAMGAVFFAPRYRETVLNFLDATRKSIGLSKTPLKGLKDPSLATNRKFFIGLLATYGIYNAMNYKQNGYGMADNPAGKEMHLQIPLPDGDYAYLPVLPSVFFIPRAVLGTATSLAKGDVEEAKRQTMGFLSQPIQLAGQVSSNQDYFGRPIYEETDTPAQRYTKLGTYLLGELSHPYISAAQAYLTGRKPPYQAVSEGLELPIKYKSAKSYFWSRFYEYQESADKYKKLYEEDTEKANIYYGEHKRDIDRFIEMKSIVDTYGALKDLQGSENLNLSEQDQKLIEQKIEQLFNQEDVAKLAYPEYEESMDAPQTLGEKLKLYAKAGYVAPLDTTKALLSGEPIRKVRGDAVVVERQLNLGDDGQLPTELDHKVPLWAGGSNSGKNLRYLDPKDHTAKSAYENTLRAKLEAGEMTKEQVAKALNVWEEANGIRSYSVAEVEGVINKIEESAVSSDIKDLVARSQQPNVLSYVTEDLKIKTITIDKPPMDKSSAEYVKWENDAYKKAREILSWDKIDDEAKNKYFESVGLNRVDVEYFDLASEVNRVKSAFVRELLGTARSKEEIIKTLVEMRREVAGKMVLTSGVIDDLVDEGIISKDEGKVLKDVDYDGGSVPKIKVSGRGKSAKLKKIKFVPLTFAGARGPSVPRIQLSSTSATQVPTSIPSTPNVRVRAPEQPKYQVRFNI